jgi:hypothetical protein
VVIKLLDKNRVAIRTKADAAAPFLLWRRRDPAASRALADGVYYLTSSIDGGGDPVRITQSCPRPPRRHRECPPKGMKMMMMTRCKGR